MTKSQRSKNAPRRPLSAFVFFVRHRRLTCPDVASKSIAEVNRLLSREWSEMTTADKQTFQDQANKERNDYNIAFEEYKKTAEYKNWLALKNSTKNQAKSKGPLKRSRNKQTANFDNGSSLNDDKCRVSIFSQDFLEYNRVREMVMRQLKKQASQLDEETALLSKHVETLVSAETRAHNQIQTLNATIEHEKSLLASLCKELTNVLTDLALTCTSADAHSKGIVHITESSVDSFLLRLHEHDNSTDAVLEASRLIKAACLAHKTKLMTVVSDER